MMDLRVWRVTGSRVAAWLALAITAGAGCSGPLSPAARDLEAAQSPGAPVRTEGWTRVDVEPYVPGTSLRPAAARGTRDALAEAWRPVFVWPGGLFVQRAPLWVAADALWRAGQPIEPHGEPVASERPAAATDPSIIFGSPDRRLLISPPVRAVASLTVVFPSGATQPCTGSYVGPWTLLLAGHCLTNDAGEVSQHVLFQPALDGIDSRVPNFDCDNSAPAGHHFSPAIPIGWLRDRNLEVDTAVIDTFPCHRAPHWFGEPATNGGLAVNADERAGVFGVIGYPAMPCPGTTLAGVFQCGARGSAYINGPWLESADIDTDKGESGGPWFIGNRVAATHIGEHSYFDLLRCGGTCNRNYGRRIDDAYKAYIDAASFDYP